MKVVHSLITIIILVSFVMGIYCAGTTKTYDFMTHLEAVSQVSQTMPEFGDLGKIWTKDIIESGHMGAHPMGASYAEVHITSWAKSGVFKASYDEARDIYWYSFVRFGMQGGTNAAQEALAPITDVFDSIMELSGRAYYTFVWLGDYVVGFFELVWTLMPFSGLVERGV